MKKFVLTMLLALCMLPARADEGMWILSMIDKLNIKTMQDMGCKLSAEDIYSVNHSSLKDAVIIFGGGCTGEIVSENGLIFTNHHCGYGSIQQLSSVEHNYLRDGFWAKSFGEELPVDGLMVKFVNRFEDVTSKVLNGVDDNMSATERTEAIERNVKSIESAEANGNEVVVKSFFAGNQYFLVEYIVYRDVRLVGTPPESIGKFGHDTDNWMWPRHTGDFSIFRVYGDKNGNPASYSANNVPLKPKHYLPISIKGTEMNDFAMTIGFPGSTERYLTSWGITNRMNIQNESMIGPRGVKQEIWHADMSADDKVNIQYASKYARSSNYWKNSIGMNRGLTRLDVLGSKRSLEKQFAEWVSQSSDRKAKYGDVLSKLSENYSLYEPYDKADNYMRECLVGGAELYRMAYLSRGVLSALDGSDTEKVKAEIEKYKGVMRDFYKDYNAATDKKVVAALCEFYCKTMDKEYWPEFLTKTIDKKFKGDYKKYAEALFGKTIFADSTKLFAFLEKPKKSVIEKDMAFEHGRQIFYMWSKTYWDGAAYEAEIQDLNRRFMAGLMEMCTDKVFYSDANFTMRLSYGTVGDYDSRDAVHYKHFTTLKGVMEKEDPNNWEFVVSPKLKKLYETKDFGRYVDKDGTMHVCFTTNNDITGGNSGSPVINGNGELIGLAFDGNWEAMSGDIAFENKLQKCINVDIRYVLFIIEKFGEAQNIIDELKIVE